MSLNRHFLNFLIISCSYIILTEAGDTQVEYESDAPGGVVIVGQPFSLTCRLHIHDVVRWDKDNQAVNCTNCRFLEERDALQGILTSRLFINSATLSDAGNYKCNSFANEEYHISVIFGEPTVNTNLDGKECKNLTLKSSLVLQCNLTEGNYTNLTWYRDNTTVIAAKDSKDRDRIRFDGTKLIIERAEEGDAGNYTCVFTLKNKEVKGYIPVGMKPIVNLKPSFTAIEGEKLKVECKVSLGWPPATISWRLNGIEYKADETNVNGSRVKILDSDQKIPNALFVLYDVKMDDRGNITCIASKTEFYNTTTEDTANIRVKDKLAALWPFLGICAEVVVLCAIILIYEKKRNKTELEESDTDQSPEQKNTPDHGKDSVRHRK